MDQWSQMVILNVNKIMIIPFRLGFCVLTSVPNNKRIKRDENGVCVRHMLQSQDHFAFNVPAFVW